MMLTVSGIHFTYNSHPILEGVGFTLEQGRVMGVLGENGAGKSTLLKCLNRILRPQAGEAFLDAENLLHMDRRAVAQRMGYVPQKHPATHLKVYESVLLGRKPHMGWTVSQADYTVVESVMERLGLAPLAMRPLNDLSGGEAQKVMIARALAQTPRVLLLDEPTSNLDLKNQIEVMTLVRSIADTQQLAAVVAIHDINLAVRFADTFLFIKNHRVHAVVDREGLTADIIRDVYGVPVTLHQVDGRTVVVPR